MSEVPDHIGFTLAWVWLIYPPISIVAHYFITRQMLAIFIAAIVGLTTIGVIVGSREVAFVQDAILASLVTSLPILFILELVISFAFFLKRG